MTTRAPEEILSVLSWAEKLGQLQIIFRHDPGEAKALARAGSGALFWPGSAARTNELQRVAVEESHHGIPLLVGLDVVHGQFTIFPTPLAQAASFDPGLAETDARISAEEAASNGVNWTFSPMVDTTRDPRWGRVVEGFGEDTYLTAAFGAAKVRGYQGDDLSLPNCLASCLKHFVAYGAGEAGRDYNTTDMSRRRLREIYLEPFRKGVEAGAASVMASFNSLNGTPMHANRDLLHRVLTEEWGFNGVVVGDAEGVAQLVPHGFVADERSADAAALGAGLDVIMGGTLLAESGTAFLDPSAVDVKRVDEAVLRVLHLKKRLGLFDNPYVDESAAITGPTEESLGVAQRAAERCTVLLKNDDGVLPLADPPKRVLLTGPYAASNDHLGAWVQHFAAPSGTLETALRTRFSGSEWMVSTAPDLLGESDAQIAEAKRLAADSDLVIVAVGEPSALTGEASSRADIRLPGDQERLIEAIVETGVPFVVLLATGRPLVMERWIDRAPTVLLTWHLGTRGPEAIARVIAGDVDPGGRVPMTFPRAVGQIPIHHDHENTGRPATTGGSMANTSKDVGLHGPDNLDDTFTSKFLDLPLGPRFAFGHGLSYTTFSITDAVIALRGVTAEQLRSGASVEVTATVSNTGSRAGDDVVLLFLSDPVASIIQPVQRLRGFQRVHLDAGESVKVSFTLDYADLGFWNDRDDYLLEAGALRLTVTDGTTLHHLDLSIDSADD